MENLGRFFLMCIFVTDSITNGNVLDVIADSLQRNPCEGRETCSECITAGPDCAWCVKPIPDGERCDFSSRINCPESYFVFPTGNFTEITNKPLSKSGAIDDIVQVKPQEVSIKLRPTKMLESERNAPIDTYSNISGPSEKTKSNLDVPFQLRIEYRQAEDYPVDLYYLMDLSNSMKDDKKNLADLGQLLAQKMKKITKKFQLGFGSFVEKVALPYSNTHPSKINEPCEGCAAPYSFRNNMPLSTDTDQFSKEVSDAETSGNFDLPEGGFDALVQAITCKEEINWRANSRKLLVFSTDAGYHFAGDGKLAGIVEPNDESCHLNTSGFYTESLNQDFPSISQINNLVQKNRINIIFAVTENQLDVYGNLSKALSESVVGKLDKDSSNIVTLIQDQYNQIKSAIKLKDDSSDSVKITYFSSCLENTKRRTNTCTDIGVGDIITFEAHIELISCPKDRNKWNQTFQIYPADINEAVTVHLEMICECDCEKPWNEEKDSDYCSGGHGTLECGVCTCNNNRYGEKCECDGSGGVGTQDNTPCYKGNDTVECSGNGKCYCGQCQCFPRENPEEKTTGKFCDCNNFSCDMYNQMFCGGPKHGICDCGKCLCLEGWKGQACECRDTSDTCIAPGTTEICNGQGDCHCGECKCLDTEEERYEGQFCQQCLICPGSCQAYKTCAQCKIFKSGPLAEEQCGNCTGIYTAITDTATVKGEAKECAFDDDDGCKFFFYYRLDSNGLPSVEVKKNKECTKPVNALLIGLSVTGGIVAIGIAVLLIWKLITTIHDSREYARFEKEANLRKWHDSDNPIYKEAVSTFQNPSFGSGN